MNMIIKAEKAVSSVANMASRQCCKRRQNQLPGTGFWVNCYLHENNY